MSKLKFNSSTVNSSVIVNLNSAINDLNHAIHVAESLSSPYNFSGSYQINNLPVKIANAKTECNNLISWLNQSITTLNNTSDNIVTDVTSINTINVTKNVSIVK